jgi:hypothetical protein
VFEHYTARSSILSSKKQMAGLEAHDVIPQHRADHEHLNDLEGRLLRPYNPDPRPTQERHIGNTAGARIPCLDVDGIDGRLGVVGKEAGKSLDLLLGVTNRGDAGFDWICGFRGCGLQKSHEAKKSKPFARVSPVRPNGESLRIESRPVRVQPSAPAAD